MGCMWQADPRGSSSAASRSIRNKCFLVASGKMHLQGGEQAIMLDLYIVGFATNLGSEHAVVVDIGGHPYRLHHASDGIGLTPRFREPKLVQRRRDVGREPQKRLGNAVLLGADDRE